MGNEEDIKELEAKLKAAKAKKATEAKPRKPTAEEILALLIEKKIDINNLQLDPLPIYKEAVAAQQPQQEAPKPMPQPPRPVFHELEEEKPVELQGSIPKKIAALEKVTVLNTNKTLCLGAIIGAFAIILAAVFSKMASYAVVLIMVLAASYILYKTNLEIVRLKGVYGLK